MVRLPEFYIEPVLLKDRDLGQTRRVEPPVLPAESRKGSFAEVEGPLGVEEAIQEARRCLRCDLDFTQPKEMGSEYPAIGEKIA